MERVKLETIGSNATKVIKIQVMKTTRKQDMTYSERLEFDAKEVIRKANALARTRQNREGNQRIITGNIDTVNNHVFKETM